MHFEKLHNVSIFFSYIFRAFKNFFMRKYWKSLLRTSVLFVCGCASTCDPLCWVLAGCLRLAPPTLLNPLLVPANQVLKCRWQERPVLTDGGLTWKTWKTFFFFPGAQQSTDDRYHLESGQWRQTVGPGLRVQSDLMWSLVHFELLKLRLKTWFMFASSLGNVNNFYFHIILKFKHR